MVVAPSLFVNHGGGPYPIMGQHENLQIAESLRNVKEYVSLSELSAIIVVTAHWETQVINISSNNKHNLLYDYNNFPKEAYTYKYGAPGNTELAMNIYQAFAEEGIASVLDDSRGWDHGVFVPMMLINPAANIPIVQLSILANQNAKDHYKMGEVLKRFRQDGVAIIGSGMTYHNEAGFKKARPSDGVIENEDFDNFIDKACRAEGEERKHMLLNWEREKGALESHTRGEADHFMPLIVNAGAGGIKGGEKVFSGVYLGKFKISGHIWREL